MKQPPDRGKEKVKAPLTTKTEQCNGRTGEVAGVKPLCLSLTALEGRRRNGKSCPVGGPDASRL